MTRFRVAIRAAFSANVLAPPHSGITQISLCKLCNNISQSGDSLSVRPKRLLVMLSSNIDSAEGLISVALAVAYRDGNAPRNLLQFFRQKEKPGKICCIFNHGRSGSLFAQSFFTNHPQALSLPNVSDEFDSYVTPDFLALFNFGLDGSVHAIETWCATLFKHLWFYYNPNPGQPDWDSLNAPENTFWQFLIAQLLLTERGTLSHESLLKIIMIAYRLARGGPLHCDKPMSFIWPAHRPSKLRKRWIKASFKEHVLLTIVRYPEKALDSMLLANLWNNGIFRPEHASSLVRLCLLEHMAKDSELMYVEPGTHYAIRYEDLHHHTEIVLQAMCALLDVPYYKELCDNTFSMQVGAKIRTVTGARKLTPDEFQCRLLNYYDCLKLRFLLQEEYRVWGYSSTCEHGLDSSLESYRNDAVAQNSSFGVQAVLAELERIYSPDEGKEITGASRGQFETRTVSAFVFAERKRRDLGITITPLLYAIESLRP